MMCTEIFCALTIPRKTIIYIYTSTTVQLNNMKNLFTLFCILSCIGASAQNLSVGVKGGSTHTTVTQRSNYFSEVDMLHAYHAGITLEYNVGSHIYIGTGAIYNQRGYKNSVTTHFDCFEEPLYTSGADVMYEYISIPLYAGFKTKGKTYGFINAGALGSFGMYQNTKNYFNNDPLADYGPGPHSLNINSGKPYLAVTGELGVGYKLSDKFSATFSASYMRELNSFRTTRLHGVFTALGMNYSF